MEGADRLTVLKVFVVLGDSAGGSEQTTRLLQEYVKKRPLPSNIRGSFRISTICRRPDQEKSTGRHCQAGGAHLT